MSVQINVCAGVSGTCPRTILAVGESVGTPAGRADDRQQGLRQAAVLQSRIRTRMFDKSRAYFFDIELGSGAFVHVYGRQADAMARRLVLGAKGLTGQGYQSRNFSWSALAAVAGGWSGGRARGP